MLSSNLELVQSRQGSIGGFDIGEARATVRRNVLGEEFADQPVILTGHQPGFFHGGVWAKHVMSRRLAEAVGGFPVNLIVDNDAPKAAYLEVPVVDDSHRSDELRVERVRFADAVAGVAFEEIGPWSRGDVDAFASRIRSAMGDRFSASMVPVYLDGVRSSLRADDWVTQTVAGRKSIDCAMGVCLTERRVSQIWGGPLLAEMVGNAERFVSAYNESLAGYRAEQGISGHDRPIPDLITQGARLELPVWVYRAGEIRRRLFVAYDEESIVLWGGEERLGSVGGGEVVRLADAAFLLERFPGLRFRPRALTLTLWARLLLADLFIHGIGGAKYDRITDRLIKSYFGWDPPAMACVSATMHLDLPRPDVTESDVRESRRRMRDFRYNPQRYVSASDGAAGIKHRVAELITNREAAVSKSVRLRTQSPNDHAARRETFECIRSLNEQLSDAVDTGRNVREEYESKVRGLTNRQIAEGREYWFAMLDEGAMRELMRRLPEID
jgi:hypothetical protein